MRFVWTVLDCISSNDADPTLQQVQWQCTASQGGVSASLSGVQLLPQTPAQQRIPYNQLVKITVLRWCFAAGVDRRGIEAQLAADVRSQLAPVRVSGLPPWTGKNADDLVVDN